MVNECRLAGIGFVANIVMKENQEIIDSEYSVDIPGASSHFVNHVGSLCPRFNDVRLVEHEVSVNSVLFTSLTESTRQLNFLIFEFNKIPGEFVDRSFVYNCYGSSCDTGDSGNCH